jgi:glutamate-1-semialdehyde 2,1-aminomutase
LSGNPVAVAAGLATLKLVSEPGFAAKIEKVTRALVAGLAEEAKRAGVDFSAQSVGSMFGIYFRNQAPTSFAEVMTSDKARFNAFFHAMLDRGVYLAPSAFEAGFVSAAHGQTEIDATLDAARESLQSLSR